MLFSLDLQGVGDLADKSGRLKSSDERTNLSLDTKLPIASTKYCLVCCHLPGARPCDLAIHRVAATTTDQPVEQLPTPRKSEGCVNMFAWANTACTVTGMEPSCQPMPETSDSSKSSERDTGIGLGLITGCCDRLSQQKQVWAQADLGKSHSFEVGDRASVSGLTLS